MALRVAASALTALLLLAGCGGGSDDDPAEPPEHGGAALVRDNGCLACHKLDGEGADGPGPDLSAIGGRRSADRIRATLLDPPAPMPPYGSLPEGDLDALVDYLASLR